MGLNSPGRQVFFAAGRVFVNRDMGSYRQFVRCFKPPDGLPSSLSSSYKRYSPKYRTLIGKAHVHPMQF